MNKQAKQFIVGQNTPTWFQEQASKGRAKAHYDEEGKLLHITVHSPTKVYEAKPGDVIVLLNTGMSVIPKAMAIRYGGQDREVNA